MTEVNQQPPQEAPPIPEHLLEAASSAIGYILETSDRRTVPINRLAAAAFREESIPDTEFSAFRQALNEDERLVHSSKGRYAIADRIDTSSTSEVEAAILEDERYHLTLLADHVALRLSTSLMETHIDRVLGIANAAIGGRLSAQEAHDVLGLLAVHPSVDPLENGNFVSKPDADFMPQAAGFHASPLGSAETTIRTDLPARSLSPLQLMRTIKDMSFSVDTRNARADRGRLATPKRSPNQHKKRGQGKSHGQKASFNTAIA